MTTKWESTEPVFGKMKMQQMVFKNAAPLKG